MAAIIDFSLSFHYLIFLLLSCFFFTSISKRLFNREQLPKQIIRPRKFVLEVGSWRWIMGWPRMVKGIVLASFHAAFRNSSPTFFLVNRSDSFCSKMTRRAERFLASATGRGNVYQVEIR
jgi:hypothetical protein